VRGDRPVVQEYWNHNTAYHRWIVDEVARRGGDLLDVGCGDGLLLARCIPVAASVTGIDPDAASLTGARARAPRAALIQADFLTHDFAAQRFDVITFVASLHHLDTRAALTTARDLLRPRGRLLVVGLAAPATPGERVLDVLRVPVARLSGLLHHETPDIGVPTRAPRESLADIRAIAAQVIPGASARQALYYRYRLSWTK